MFDNTMIPAIALITYNRRILIVTLFLAFMAFLLVATSIAAFVYVTRKGSPKHSSADVQRNDIFSFLFLRTERILRKCHLISVIMIILVELAFLVAVVSCCIIQSRSKQARDFDALLAHRTAF